MAKPGESAHTVWSWRDILLLLGTLLIGGTVTTVVGGTVVIGGGALLLLFSPLLLLFSPVLVPAVIIFGLVAGGAAVITGGSALFVGAVAWLYSYLRGGRPYGAESADALNSTARATALRAKEHADFLAGKALEAAGNAREAANGTVASTYGYLQQKSPVAA